MTRPALVADVSALDPLATPPATRIPAARLQETMVLLDPDLGTPLYWLDHRLPATRNSGNVSWLAHHLDTGRLERLNLFARTDVPVLAR